VFFEKRELHFSPVYAYNKKNQCIRSVGCMSWEPKKTAVSALGLPRDVVLGDVLVNFVGRGEVNVENYRSILIYTDTLVKLQAKNCKVLIHGSRLRIDYYTAEEMKITGQITSLEFET
jgi:sporulation protein YqfC